MQLKIVDDLETFQNSLAIAPIVSEPELLIDSIEFKL